MNDIFEAIKEIICEYVETDPDTITESSSLRYDIGASSFDLMNIATAVEEKYKISVSDKALPRIKTVGDIAALLKEKLN